MQTEQLGIAAGKSERLTRTGYAQVPIELLEKYGDKKGVVFVYCWLWHYASRDDQAFPSVDRLAAECRMKPDDVRACLKSLAGDGWISRVDRPGQTTLFHVRKESDPVESTCFPNWLLGKVTGLEIAVLVALQSHYPNIDPSLVTLSKESGMSQRTVQRVLGDLQEKGLVIKRQTRTQHGTKGANNYELLIWDRPLLPSCVEQGDA